MNANPNLLARMHPSDAILAADLQRSAYKAWAPQARQNLESPQSTPKPEGAEVKDTVEKLGRETCVGLTASRGIADEDERQSITVAFGRGLNTAQQRSMTA